MSAWKTLLKTEGKLALRTPDLVLFGILFPVGMLLLLGAIYGGKPAFDGAEYTFLDQSFAAVAAVGICACGLMGFPLSVADYRHRKILRRFKVTPVSPGLLLGVQSLVQFGVALFSGLLVYAVAAVVFGYRMNGPAGWFILAYLLVALAIFALGMVVASLAPSQKAANLICTVLYFPMLFLSGATVPYEVMPPMMRNIVDILPLTQGIKLLKGLSLGQETDRLLFPLLLMAAMAVVCVAVSFKTFKWE